MGTTPNKYSSEFRERAVRLVGEARKEHSSEWATLRAIAEKLGCTAETLRKWVRQSERQARPNTSPSTEQRVKELERENRELKRANEILRKASAYFAQAELDRRPR
jgi:transposase-like protein